MNCVYFFRLLKPGNKISVIIDQNDKEGKVLYASQDGVKSELNNNTLIKAIFKTSINDISKLFWRYILRHLNYGQKELST